MGLAAGLFLTAMALTAVAREDDKLTFDKLPKAVQDAVKTKYPKAEVLHATKETEGGKTSYEVSMMLQGKGLDVTFSPTGEVEVVEKEIDAKDLPAKVRAPLDKKYPKASFKKVEEISKAVGGKMVVDVYEILFTTADKKTVEMTIKPDGTVTEDKEKTSPKKEGN
jgi:hypothetical protein